MTLFTRKRKRNVATIIAALILTNMDLLDQGTAAGVNTGLIMIADELKLFPHVQKILNDNAQKEDEKNETGN